LVGRVIQRVVHELIDDAEVAAVMLERLFLRARAFGDHRSDPAGGREQRCRL
jgi:hypothetical protein